MEEYHWDHLESFFIIVYKFGILTPGVFEVARLRNILSVAESEGSASLEPVVKPYTLIPRECRRSSKTYFLFRNRACQIYISGERVSFLVFGGSSLRTIRMAGRGCVFEGRAAGGRGEGAATIGRRTNGHRDLS